MRDTMRTAGALLLALAAPLSLRADPPESAPKPAGIFRVADVRPGMEVIAYTVFAGSRIEPFHGRVLGTARNFFGPSRHVVLVDFYEPRVRHTGIVRGMSGSPVYIGDKVLGAVALVLSPLPRDAIAGVTPLEYMLAEADATPGGPSPRERDAQGSVPAMPFHDFPSGAPGAPPGVELARARVPSGVVPGGLLRSIGTPLSFSGGVRPETFERYRGDFAALGLEPVLGGGGSDPESSLGPESLQAGAPVSAVLANGDLTLDASGTITYRDGNRIYAFGHPFLQQGRMRLPLAPATVVTTLADQTFSYKVTSAGAPAGTILFDRTTAIVGEVGKAPRMFPMTVRVTREGTDLASYAYNVCENPWLTPLVVQVLVANSIGFRWDYDEEATYRLRGTIRIKDRPTLTMQETYTVAPDPRSATPFAIAADVGLTFAMLFMNPFAAVEIESIDLRFDAAERGLIDRLDGVFVDPEKVRAGESANIRVAVRGIRGARRVVPLAVPIPAWAAGRRLALRVADSGTIRNEAGAAGSQMDRASSLEQLVDLLASRPRADKLYVQLLAFAPDAIVYHKRLPSLPSSVVEVLERGGGPYRRLPRALVWETTIPADGIAVGTQELMIEVRP